MNILALELFAPMKRLKTGNGGSWNQLFARDVRGAGNDETRKHNEHNVLCRKAAKNPFEFPLSFTAFQSCAGRQRQPARFQTEMYL
jgi:hypothetical protein